MFDNDKLSSQSMADLIWYLENDPYDAIRLATDAIIYTKFKDNNFKRLIPLIAKHLENEDDLVRETAVSCIISRLNLSEYAGKAFYLAKNDPENNVRGLATSGLGSIINHVDPLLQKQIAQYLYDIIQNSKNSFLNREANISILKAMEVPIPVWHKMSRNDLISLLEQFKDKYYL